MRVESDPSAADTRSRGRPLRSAAAGACAVGSLASVAFTLFATHRVASPAVLWVLFAGWVISPFVAMIVIDAIWDRRLGLARTAVDAAMLLIGVASPVVYAVAALAPGRPKTAVFVIVAPVSWLMLAIALGVALAGRRRAR